MIRLTAFKAVEDPLRSDKFIEGHNRILEIYGVAKVTSANVEWKYDPSVYVIAAEMDNKILGGARIKCYGGSQALPIEDAISDMDYGIHKTIKNYSKNGTGEFCGLWNSREIAGLGIGSFLLTKAGVSIVSQLKLTSLFALCASYTVGMAQKVGFEIETSLGNNGTFYYPKEDFIATVMLLKNTETLDTADPIERESIFDLRRHPNQTKIEAGRNGTFELEYNLEILENSAYKLTT